MPKLADSGISLRAYDANGDPVSGALLKVFVAGTSTPVTVYSDDALTTPTTAAANAAGVFSPRYLPAGTYKIDIQNPDTLSSLPGYPVDNVSLDADSYGTVADLLASTEAGRGVGEIWGAGGFRYQEVSSAATDQHVTTAGGVKLKVLPTYGTYHAEAWASPVTVTSFNAAVQNVIAEVKPATANFQESPNVTFKCSAKITVTNGDQLIVYDTANISGNADIMGAHIDLKNMRITAGTGMEADDFLISIKARNCEIWTPGVDCADLSSGIIMNRCITATIYANNIIERVANDGFSMATSEVIGAATIESGDYCTIKKVGTTDFTAIGAPSNAVGEEFQATGAGTGTGEVFVYNGSGERGETDNTVMYGPQTYEGKSDDDVADRQGVGLFVNTYDWTIYDYRGGWCEIPIYFGPGAKEVTMIGIHPFNGIPGGVAPTDPTLIRVSEFAGDIYVRNSYLDNGLVHDYSGGRFNLSDTHFLELNSAVTLTQPRMRVYCNSALDQDAPNTIIKDCGGVSVGFYDSAGTLSPSGNRDGVTIFDFDPDLSALNSTDAWNLEELENVPTNMSRRMVRSFLRDNDDIADEVPNIHNFFNGRMIEQFRSQSSTGRLVSDPENGEHRTEFARDVTNALKNFAAWQSVTAASNTFAVTDTLHQVTTAGASATVNTATGGLAGDFLMVRPASGKTITIAHNAGGGSVDKFYNGGADINLTSVTQALTYIHDGANWLLIGSNGTAPVETAEASGIDLRATGTNNSFVDFYNNGTLRANVFWDATNTRFTIGTPGAHDIYLRTNNTDAIIVSSAQDVTIANGDLTISTGGAFPHLRVTNEDSTGDVGYRLGTETSGDFALQGTLAGAFSKNIIRYEDPIDELRFFTSNTLNATLDSSGNFDVPNGYLQTSTADDATSGLKVLNTGGSLANMYFTSGTLGADFNISYNGSGASDIVITSSTATANTLNGLWNFAGGEIRVNGTKVVGTQVAALPADATDLASAITLVNAIKDAINENGHGLAAGT